MVEDDLRPWVREQLARHGVTVGEGDTVDGLHDRLEDVYVAEVRALRERQRRGEIPLRDYSGHVRELRDRYPLLGLPVQMWRRPESS